MELLTLMGSERTFPNFSESPWAWDVEGWLAEMARRNFLPSSIGNGDMWGILFHAFLMRELDQRVCVKELHQALGLPRATLSRCLKNLEIDGWISRQRSECDKRMSKVTLTDQGASLVEDWISARTDLIERRRRRIFGCFD